MCFVHGYLLGSSIPVLTMEHSERLKTIAMELKPAFFHYWSDALTEYE